MIGKITAILLLVTALWSPTAHPFRYDNIATLEVYTLAGYPIGGLKNHIGTELWDVGVVYIFETTVPINEDGLVIIPGDVLMYSLQINNRTFGSIIKDRWSFFYDGTISDADQILNGMIFEY